MVAGVPRRSGRRGRSSKIVYRALIKPVLFRLPPERAHRVAETALRTPVVWMTMRPVSGVSDHRLTATVAGLKLPSPIGVAAGFDKDCKVLRPLLDLGFGFATGGTVTLAPRPGNPRPRLLRDPEREALVNSLGFPGAGLSAAEKRLARYSSARKRIFVSIAGTIEDEVIECHRRLQPLCAVMELNISSPNTAGLRVFHEPGRLRGLVEDLARQKTVPLLVKMPPWSREAMARREALRLIETAIDAGADGLIVANTQPVEHAGLAVGRGGLSGAPLLEHTVRMVAEARAVVRNRGSILASGGVSRAQDVWRLIGVGANAVQLYTAFVYRGPTLPRQLNRGLLKLMERAGARSLEDISGPPPG